MRRVFPRLVMAMVAASVVAGCSSGDDSSAVTSGAATADSSAASSTAAGQSSGATVAPSSGAVEAPSQAAGGSFAANGSCALQHREDLILWEKRPDSPATAKLVGDIDHATCQYAVDSLALTEPTDPGYCDVLARPSDNPGYDIKAASPPKPAHILTKAGNGC